MKWIIHHTDSVLTLITQVFGWTKKLPLLPILIDEQLKLFTFIFRPKRFMKMQQLRTTLVSRLNLETAYHRFGGLEFRHEGKEVAHLHSDGLLDIRFPKGVACCLIEKGMTGVHHVYPVSGWTSILIRGNTDVESCFQLVCWKLLLQKNDIDVNTLLEKVIMYHYER